MGKDFIARKSRYCLWLKDILPSELKKYPKNYGTCKKRS